jgi:hypothetical protein
LRLPKLLSSLRKKWCTFLPWRSISLGIIFWALRMNLQKDRCQTHTTFFKVVLIWMQGGGWQGRWEGFSGCQELFAAKISPLYGHWSNMNQIYPYTNY